MQVLCRLDNFDHARKGKFTMTDNVYRKPTIDEMRRISRADPEYNHPTTEKGKRRKRMREEAEKAGAQLLEELRAAGFRIEELNDVMRIKFNSKAAIPILLWWLPRVDNSAVKGIIARALTDKWARPEAQRPLLEEFKLASDQLLKSEIAGALEVVQDDRIADQVLELVQDRHHGPGRMPLAAGLWKFKDPRAVDIAIKLLEDEDVIPGALLAVGRFKPKKAIPYLEKLLNHSKPGIRKKAKQVLERIKIFGV